MPVNVQLDEQRVTLQLAQSSAERLAASVGEKEWSTRPASGGWSAAECVAHLTMTTDAYLPLLNAARAAVPAGATVPPLYRRGFAAALLEWSLEPPARIRSKTLPVFVPGAERSKSETLADFVRSQTALLAWLDGAEHVPLDQVIMASPFNARLRYNAYAAIRILAAHQRRHLWQAERATRGIP